MRRLLRLLTLHTLHTLQTLLLGLALLPVSAAAQPQAPSPFQRIGFEQRVGRQVPPDLLFRDETGRQVQSEKQLEIVIANGKVVRAGDQFGVGMKR